MFFWLFLTDFDEKMVSAWATNGKKQKNRAQQQMNATWRMLGTFRSEDEDDYEYEFSVLSMHIRFGGQNFSKCACSEQKTRTRSRPRPTI